MTKQEAVKVRQEIRDAAETLAPMVRKVVNDDLVLGVGACIDLASVLAVFGMESDQADRTKLVAAFADNLEAWATKRELEENHRS
jgi:hypothetical protein|tara:strand:+ start:205 stop:459 length:255 start_codon:yes stop_codon:yes gene_type:complete